MRTGSWPTIAGGRSLPTLADTQLSCIVTSCSCHQQMPFKISSLLQPTRWHSACLEGLEVSFAVCNALLLKGILVRNLLEHTSEKCQQSASTPLFVWSGQHLSHIPGMC